MTANYIPIAMKCNLEQFYGIKDMIPLPIANIGDFYSFPYLLIDDGVVSNCTLNFIQMRKIETLLYFDAKHFLECCGLTVLEDVSEEKIWKGAELQVKHIDSNKWKNCSCHVEYRLKPKEVNPIQGDVDALLAKAKSLGIKLKVEFE